MTSFAKRLLAWYREHGRHLPWRGSREPYAVWVSEVMLQQTRVEVVIPYFARWMQRFPDLSSLAAASEQDVLRVWEGMGYYGRARNLYRASKIVMSEYKGELPRDVKTLRRLPGIGAYIAGAIVSIAYGMDEPALDGNIRRVFARLENPLREGERIEELLAGETVQLLVKGDGDNYFKLQQRGTGFTLARIVQSIRRRVGRSGTEPIPAQEPD